MTKAKTWQKPKESHPWRQYKDKVVKIEIEDRTDIVGLREFLYDIIENWDRMEVTMFGSMGDRTYTLGSLPQRKAAAYIVGIIKRNYINDKI